MLGHALKLVVVGLTAGLLGAATVVRLLGTFLFGVSAVNPTILAAVVALLAVVAFVAAYLPARRAANLDPIATLRCE